MITPPSGGKGMKVARTIDDSGAVRVGGAQATAAFGRGECYVERDLDKPRHVEAQVIADQARQRRRRHSDRFAAAKPLLRSWSRSGRPHCS